MAESDWVIQRNGDRFNASNVAMLQQWATEGKIQPGDQIWNPARGDWQSAAETPEVASLLVKSLAPVRVVLGPIVSTETASGLNRASFGARGAAYLIDCVPAALLALIALIPLVGHVFAGVLLGLYWLYRDALHYSLGKLALGLQPVRTDGAPASPQQLRRRNLPLALAGFMAAIPLLGMFLGPLAGFVAIAANVLLLSTEGQSLGDKWAGTTVVKRT